MKNKNTPKKKYKSNLVFIGYLPVGADMTNTLIGRIYNSTPHINLKVKVYGYKIK